MSSWVTVTGPPSLIWFMKSGITEPFEPKTFPNLTATNSVLDFSLYVWTNISQILFVVPITDVGFTALSVEIKTNLETSFLSQALITFNVPKTLFLIAEVELFSISGTCLWAAAWKTTSGLYFPKIISILSASLIDSISTTRSKSL